MNHAHLILAAIACMAALPFPAQAEETNSLPKSRLEIFEATTGSVIIRGTDEVGSVAGKFGLVTVKCKEARDATTNQREFGIAVTVRMNDQDEDTTVVDYDELDSVLRGLDYIAKADWSISSLSHFEAGFTTRSGLKLASYSSRRTGTIEAAVISNRILRCRASLTMAQLAQIRVFIEQAKSKIELIQKEK